jgi:hypothetical protein
VAAIVATGLVFTGMGALEGGLSDLAIQGERVGYFQDRGMLTAASKGKGNFGIGSATAADADIIGKAWVGDGYTVAGDGRTIVSADGLRQYRPPAYKRRFGVYQANLEWRPDGVNEWQSNAHIWILDLP